MQDFLLWKEKLLEKAKYAFLNVKKIFRKLDIKPFIFVFLIFDILLFASITCLFFLTVNNLTAIVKEKNINISSYPYLLKLSSDLNVSSKALIVYDPEARVVVMGKNENLRFAPASSAKIMSAIVATEYYPLGKILKAYNLNQVEGSRMGLFEGEEISVENLLYGMMLPSGNDAAYVLAENFNGKMDGFVNAMNRKVKELRLENTKFFDPAGYSDDNYTSAIDLAKIGAYAIKNIEIKKIVGTAAINVSDSKRLVAHRLENLNELLGIDGINGIKTGFTEEAGGVLVTSVVKNNKTYIIVVLKSEDRFYDTKELILKVVKSISLINY